MEVDAALVGRSGHFVGRHDSKIDVGAVRLRMSPEPFASLGRPVAIRPDSPYHPTHRFLCALAADAVDNEHGRPFTSFTSINRGHIDIRNERKPYSTQLQG